MPALLELHGALAIGDGVDDLGRLVAPNARRRLLDSCVEVERSSSAPAAVRALPAMWKTSASTIRPAMDWLRLMPATASSPSSSMIQVVDSPIRRTSTR